MKIVMAGCGNIGYYLAKTLEERGYKLSVIEQNRNRCMLLDTRVYADSRIEVTCGDATSEDTLKDAGAENADVFIAVTGQDQNNLVACLLAKKRFHAGRIVTRVNNPKNIRIFQAIGVDSMISSASRIADVIEQELGWTNIDSILATKTDNARIRQFIVDAGSSAAGKEVFKLKFPSGSIMVVAVRGSHAYIPNGAFHLEAGDEVMVMAAQKDFEEIEKLFYSEAEK